MKNLIHRRLASAPTVRSSEVRPGFLGRVMTGYAAKFGVESEVLYDPAILKDKDGNPLPFIEILDPDVFTRTLREKPDVRALYNHNTDAVLGRTSSGTLRLAIDETGLGFEDDLPDTIDGQRAAVLVDRRDIDGCSFGFFLMDDEITMRAGMPALHTVYDVELYEVSIAVAFPAYTQTETTLRNGRNRGRSPSPTPNLDRARRALRAEGRS